MISKPWGQNAGRTLRIRWKALLIYTAATLTGLWLMVASSVYFFVKIQIGYTEVSYPQILGLPFTLKAYRQSKGEFYLNQGLIAARESRWRDAFDLLRIGLPSRPENEEARLTLARIYLMARRPDQAKTIFVEGLDYERDDQTNYIRTVLTFLFNQQADGTVVEICDKLIETDKVGKDLQDTLLVARMYAYFNRDQFDQAIESIKGTPVENSLQAKVIQARIGWEKGLNKSSLLVIKSLHESNPSDDEVYRTLQNYLREQDQLTEGRRLALARQIAYPQRPDAYLDFMALCEDDKMEARRDDSIEDFLRIFRNDPAILIRFQSMAADRGWNRQAWRVVDLLGPTSSREKITAMILAIEADISAGDFLAANQNASKKLGPSEPLTESDRMSLLGLISIAELGLGMTSEGESSLNRALTSSMITPAAYVALGKHLQKIKRPDLAERAYAQACDLDPLNQNSTALLLQLRLSRNALEDSLELMERFTEMRKPDEILMAGLYKSLNSDRYLYLENKGQTIQAMERRSSLFSRQAN